MTDIEAEALAWANDGTESPMRKLFRDMDATIAALTKKIEDLEKGWPTLPTNGPYLMPMTGADLATMKAALLRLRNAAPYSNVRDEITRAIWAVETHEPPPPVTDEGK